MPRDRRTGCWAPRTRNCAGRSRPHQAQVAGIDATFAGAHDYSELV
ncbi:hypothetical protein EAS61_21235 [Bradyrhizobium zhanjiangense]|uniref:Uncharacterized protein n=1 Tax=Bradyrhizobium zhanjiangense TaxID=1325107 RepID=A0A4Q0QJI1_9BRAD|nr:hypothetical protein EAS62_33335 [Bradyrhizobium zhanjiangense]RXG93848.1 hypothetical protein EAS61_21235 [Bradyrhizobium zhanjiangense]